VEPQYIEGYVEGDRHLFPIEELNDHRL